MNNVQPEQVTREEVIVYMQRRSRQSRGTVLQNYTIENNGSLFKCDDQWYQAAWTIESTRTNMRFYVTDEKEVFGWWHDHECGYEGCLDRNSEMEFMQRIKMLCIRQRTAYDAIERAHQQLNKAKMSIETLRNVNPTLYDKHYVELHETYLSK